MGRPRQATPTPGEYEILEVIWERGPSTVREVLTELNRKRTRAYTTVMTLMKGMAEKGLLTKKEQGRAFLYTAKTGREKTRSKMVKELLGRAFGGSTKALMIHLLQEKNVDKEELAEIRKTIESHEKKKE